MEPGHAVKLLRVEGMPEVHAGDDAAELVWSAVNRMYDDLLDRDIIVVAHKIISKAEGRVVDLSTITPSDRAVELGEKLSKDPRKVEVILQESQAVIRAQTFPGRETGTLICRHRLGFISANAGVDESNVPGEDRVVLLPEHPDRSAQLLRSELERRSGRSLGVVITDTFGRPWRMGLVDIAIGLAGVPAKRELVGTKDAQGRELKASNPCLADQLAAAAGMLMGKADQVPVVIVRGLDWSPVEGSALDLVRSPEEDLFL